MPILRKNKKKEFAEEAKTGEENMTVAESPKEKEPKKSPGKFNRFLRAVGIGALLIALGAAGLFLAVYQPRTNELNNQIKTMQGNVSAADAKVTTANAEVERLKAVETDLTKAKADLTSLQAQLDKVSAKKSVYEIQSNVNTARIALLKDDTARAGQSLQYLIQNLSTLEVPAFPDITKNLETRLTGIQTAMPTDKTKALSDLEALFNDLVLLADNIK
jgi:phage-related protein